MPMLRPTSIQHVFDELAASRFGVVGFDTAFPDQGDTLCTITFLARKGSRFAIQGTATATNPIAARVSPGQYKNEDLLRFDSFKDCLAQIQPWVKRIHEDLRVQDPKYDDMLSFRQALDAHIKSSVKDEGALFSEAEVSELMTKLKALEDRIQEMEDKHVLTDKEVRHLRQVVEDAKADLPALPKGVWYKTAGGKVWEVMKKAASTSETKQLLADAARKLIGM
jgi:uncharacterized protein YdcH (DUF465 family)